MKKRVELLSPAGSFEGFIGALNAGADAVYLAGSQFGARAYAKNFTKEELIEALDYAHLFHKKIYLTLNTLVKESEFDQIYDYLKPFYEHGLDGIIVQDIGVLRYLHRQFPQLELHASTQLTITGSEGANLLKELNVVRVVPARELSLQELIQMKQKTGLEIETFVHGAICYCYSGQCLFSSLIGGRSGNRGRCAQPCRLPYQGSMQDTHYLSLKDMCTIEILPELIRAGIDSFKIEGRMKRAEYTAGVTAVYRKYIDAYYSNPDAPFQISKKDFAVLNHLYIRNERSEGYYHRQNGKEMLTLNDPSYAGTEDTMLAQIAEKYLKERKKVPVCVSVSLEPGQKAEITVTAADAPVIQVYGNEVAPAQKQPLTEESVEKQIRKTGNTNFEITELSISLTGECFYSVKELNELRRNAFEQLQTAMLQPYRREVSCIESTSASEEMEDRTEHRQHLRVEVNTLTQLQFLLGHRLKIDRIYVSFELFLHQEKETVAMIQQYREQTEEACRADIFIALPYIVRENKAEQFLGFLQKLGQSGLCPDGFLLRSLEEVLPVQKLFPNALLIPDANLYVWNLEAKRASGTLISEEYTIPVELNHWEMKPLLTEQAELMVYGHLPLMISANCIKKTEDRCDHTAGNVTLSDRYHKQMTVRTVCSYCYNIIYNSVTFSLHSKWKDLKEKITGSARISFLDESEDEMQEILEFYTGRRDSLSITDYTNGHYARGVE